MTRLTHLKPSSERPLEIAWRLHVKPRWGDVPLSDLRHSAVQAWVTKMQETHGATSVLRAYGVLAAILDVAVADRRILTNPARGVKLPRKVRREHRYLTHEQVSQLAIAAGPKKQSLVLVLAYCGLRWGEAAGLRVRDVDLVRRRLLVSQNAVEVGREIYVGTPKTHKRRSVPFPPTLGPILEKACWGNGPDELVSTDDAGSCMHRSKTGKGWFLVASTSVGIVGMTPHDLRHTAASLAIQAGANVKAVQRMLGHSSAAMALDVYADLFGDDLDAVAGRLELGLASTSEGKMWANGDSGPVPPTEVRPHRDTYRRLDVGPVGLEPTTRGVEIVGSRGITASSTSLI